MSTQPPEGWVTIAELADTAGMTVRNIRAYQTRGLLGPPRMVGRVGYYGPEHVKRLDQIHRLQQERFNLAAIRSLLDRGEEFTDQVREFRRELQDNPAWVPLDEESIRLTLEYDPTAFERFQEIGTVRIADDGTYWSIGEMMQLAWELNGLGASPATIIELLYATHRYTRRVAQEYVGHLRRTVWQPALDDSNNHPANGPAVGTTNGAGPDVAQLRESYALLTPVAERLVSLLFQLAFSREAERGVEAELAALDGLTGPTA